MSPIFIAGAFSVLEHGALASCSPRLVQERNRLFLQHSDKNRQVKQQGKSKQRTKLKEHKKTTHPLHHPLTREHSEGDP